MEKVGGRMKELATIGVAHSEAEADNLVLKAKEWISKEEARRQPRLNLFGEEREACEREREEVSREDHFSSLHACAFAQKFVPL